MKASFIHYVSTLSYSGHLSVSFQCVSKFLVQCLQVLVSMFVCCRSWQPSRPEFRSWRWKKRLKGWRRRRTDVTLQRCSSWPAALGLVRQPVVCYVTCWTAKHWLCLFFSFFFFGSLDSIFLARCAASQPTGRWGNCVTIWLTPGTLHCGHNSVHMCLITAQWDEVVSPREAEGSSLLPVAIFCLCGSPHPFHPPFPLGSS